jgi:hypothetical protein
MKSTISWLDLTLDLVRIPGECVWIDMVLLSETMKHMKKACGKLD